MSVSFVVNSAIHAMSKMTPSQMVFHRGMILHATYAANWEHVCLHKQSDIDCDDTKENENAFLINTQSVMNLIYC